MLKNIHNTTRLLIVLSGLVLSACGGGGNDAADPSKVLQESALYNPATNPSGTVEQPGQTAVLGLQANVSDLPPPPNIPNKGVEDLWFEVKDSQSMQFALDADTLAAIDRVEVRDQGNALLATVNAATPSVTLSLAPGRYQALLYASAADTEPVLVFAQYATGHGGAAQMQGASAAGKVQPQWDFFSAAGVFFGTSCRGCDLSQVSFPRWNFTGRDFSLANFDGAILVGANFVGANLGGSYFRGTNLGETNLSGANLSGANLSGAILTGAILAGANLAGANLAGANLNGAIWVDGRRCEFGSIGSCQ
jgi:hypothetical protein